MHYSKITGLVYETNCSDCSKRRWDKLMNGHVRASRVKIHQLVKKFLPNLYDGLYLNFYNPYNYFRTKTHLILVHSGIEYFLRIKI